MAAAFAKFRYGSVLHVTWWHVTPLVQASAAEVTAMVEITKGYPVKPFHIHIPPS